ncbi:uncharacterized protein [Hyperolius riggenbachi]|uniref:uncharacterized protein isoform X3 n=1 Tax=Hyperolius riggenbachi TaxID=752182 RepID=UPI0035A29215
MSHGVMKKPQPFTIATRLSVPKYGNSSTSGPCAAPPDIPRMLPHLNLPHCGPQNCLLDSDHYCAPESLERSVRKITLSKHEEGVCSRGSARSSPPALNLYRKEAGLTRGVARRSPPGLNIYSEEGGLTMGDARGSPPALILQGNSNNNNSRGLRHLSPDAADYLCDGTRRGTKGHKPASAAPSKRPSSLSPSPQGERKAPPNGIGLDGNRRAFAHNETLQTAQPWQDNTEQGESRFQGQLQYPSNQQIWLCPEQGDTGEHHTSRIRLNQMGDHLTSTGSTRAQLQSLRDQWQLLKQSATNHSKAVGGAKGLQEFNKKADELEIWMRQKEENPTLSVLLDENLDKVQLTRRILDLKQEQLYYSTLQESLNCVAQQLEKQGGPETRGTANRRKHLNRMWLRLQGTLSDYQRSLQLALEGASLWQQADTTLRAMEEKGKAAGSSGYHAQDLRDIARQIMMLDIAASQVSSLHPMLASRVQQKQRQVKEIWTQLQQSLRTGKFPRSSLSTRDSEPPLTPDAPEQNCVGTQQQCMLGSQTVVSQWPNSWEHDLRDISPSQTGVNRFAKSPGDGDDSPHGRQRCPPSSDKAEVDGLHSELNSTSQWLQSLEHLLSEPASMRSPELLRRDLRQASVLEKELKSRSAALQSMGRAGRSSGWDEEAQVRLQEVEERCQTVQDALRRRVSDLRDTLVLSEFMKVVQKEEERRKREALESSQPIKEEPDSSMILAGRKEVFTPLEELQEAVEMLNDAVKERERALAVTKETTNLEEQLSAVSRAVQSASRRGRDLRRKMEEAEQDYIAVKKQAELRDLQEISDLQEQMEADVLQIQAEVTRLEGHRDQLQTLCPQRSAALGRSMEEGLQAWARLQEDIQRNRSRLCRTAQLREFTLSYLGMISWTEETRTRILSDRPEERLSPAWREGLERSIDSKMKEFEKLASVGWKLIGEDRQLAQMIKERLEELQGMLSWVLMRWRCQKHQSIMGNKAQRMRSKEVAESTQPEEDGVLPPHKALQPQEAEHPADEAATPDPAPPPLRGPVRRRYRRRALSPILFQQPLRLSEGMDMEDGAELQDDGPRKCAGGPLWLEPKALPIASDMAEMEEEEPLVVSTYLHVKESERPPEMCQSFTVPRPSKKIRSSEQFDLMPENDSSKKQRSSLLFSSLKRKEKAQRCTVEGIMDLYPYEKPNMDEGLKFETSTWPPKLDRTSPQVGFENCVNYVQNPLTKDINAECVLPRSDFREAEEKNLDSTHTSPQTACPHVALGSVLTLELTKEPSLVDNIRESLRIVSVDDKKSPHFSESEVADEEPYKVDGVIIEAMQTSPSPCAKSWIEALANSPGYCRHNIHGYGRSVEGLKLQELEDLNDDFINFEINRLSPIDVLHHLEPEWNKRRNDLILAETQCAAASKVDSSPTNCPDGSGSSAFTVLPKTEDSLNHYGSTDRKSEHSDHGSTYVEFFSICGEKARTLHEPQTINSSPEKRTCHEAIPHSFPEVLHPDQEFLEKDEEELEDIWNNAKKRQLGSPTKKPHAVPLKTADSDHMSRVKPGTLNFKGSQVVMKSEPNVLVATFTLPTSAVLHADPMSEETELTGEPSWSQEQRVVFSGTCTDSSRREDCQKLAAPALQALKSNPNGTEASKAPVPRKLDYQLMEGSLEKKCILQPGGKKASYRTWGMFHAVLVRRTLCFYHDRKHSTKSPVSAPPLHLTDAVCTPESDYTKRNNCFRLRLQDGSEYLFRALTASLLQEWVCKLRHNAALQDSGQLRETSLMGTRSPPDTSRGDPRGPQIPELCQPVPIRGAGEQRMKLHQEEPLGTPASIRADAHHRRSPPPDTGDSEFDVSLTASRRRSRSFSSVMYQKMASFSAPQDPTPSYSVTLYLDEPLLPRGRCHSFAAPQVTRHSADLKPRNKSVFRKLFWKKE